MGKNIILIGMPGSGKTTTGEVLSGILGYGFADTDAILLERLGKPPRDVVNEEGVEYFRAVQGEIISSVDFEDTVIATGGSVVYSDAAMRHLKKNGLVVYLKVDTSELEKRLDPQRRLARNPGQTLKDLYEERSPLYERYSDIMVECSDRDVRDIAAEIFMKLKNMLK
jgi:shikimate kinase